MSNVLRLGDHVRTRGEHPVKQLGRAGYPTCLLEGVVEAFEGDAVRVRITRWGDLDRQPQDISSCFHLADLELIPGDPSPCVGVPQALRTP